MCYGEWLGGEEEKVAGFYLGFLIIFFPCQGNDCIFSTSEESLSDVNFMVWDVREAQTLFSIEQVISEYIKSIFLKIP